MSNIDREEVVVLRYPPGGSLHHPRVFFLVSFFFWFTGWSLWFASLVCSLLLADCIYCHFCMYARKSEMSSRLRATG